MIIDLSDGNIFSDTVTVTKRSRLNPQYKVDTLQANENNGRIVSAGAPATPVVLSKEDVWQDAFHPHRLIVGPRQRFILHRLAVKLTSQCRI